MTAFRPQASSDTTISPQDAAPSQVDVDTAIRDMISLADALLTLMDQENRHLAEGMPVPLGEIVERKHALADEFRALFSDVRLQQAMVSTATPELASALLERGRDLNAALNENGTRLQKAIAASRHRVETIMRAIRQETTRPSAYGGNGRYEQRSYAARPVSLRPGVEA
ncbi:FlgN protein [Breoghania corrubedonensis]|uniref:FlgN protein n=1 Tax=Breoghania corrubedonensis TaxID=665038 RepID=A0A2T5V6E9_9HYPH|nr:flagellar export chaperone FlgN [Breoghania corrubedonensis]PTW59329.1 FlgN protein [Breoghania corrubedonensis]